MKIYIQTRLVDNNALTNFQQIVNSGNYISNNSENFAFNWANSKYKPDLLHPEYANYYQSYTISHTSNWLMDLMRYDKSIKDPRIRYYFYRQTNSVPTNILVQNELLRCAIEPIPAHYSAIGAVYCYIGYPIPEDSDGYWGRDHGNGQGFPPNAALLTGLGLYPVGGRFDDESFQRMNNGVDNLVGALGAGATPIILSSTVDFWRAEAALFGGSGNATSLMVSGINKSIDYVKGFINRQVTEFDDTFLPPASDDAIYIAEATTNMNTASSTNDKLDVLAKEFFISLFGNGVDAFNFYRRTGAPSNIQPHINSNPGGFIRSHYYPASYVNNNINMTQKPDVTIRVFWDTNPLVGFPQNN